MSHVDEGRLSEYLDRQIGRSVDRVSGGSANHEEVERHLAECAECRARLDEVRAVRERAAELLRAAAPVNVAMPQFAELEARARARKVPRRALTMQRLTALGWAATIVLAVGVGWLARGSFGLGGSRADRLSDQTTTTAAAPAEAAAPDSSASADVAGAVREGGAALSQTAPPSQAAEAVAQDVAPPAATREARALAAAPTPELRRAEPQAPAVGNLGEREQAQAAKALAVEGARTRQGVAAVVAADERHDAPGRGVVEVDAGANELTVRVDDALRAKSWVGVTAQDAERHLGAPVHVVEGLAVESIRIGDVDGQPAVAVIQILPGGEPLEIVQWRSGDAAAQVQDLRPAEEAPRAQAPAAPTEGAARSKVVVAYDSTVLLLRAPIAADSLAVLAGLVR